MNEKKYLKEIIQEKEPKNIFNVDEIGRFYMCTPNNTLTFKGDKEKQEKPQPI